MAKTLDGFLYNEMLLTEDGPLLLNYAPTLSWENNGFLHVFHYNATLVQLDHDLNFLWGKEYYGENFPYYAAGIAKSLNGNLLMSHSTFGAFPVVLTELDNEGNILSQKGYPNHQPQMDILSDGSLLMSSEFNYDVDGNLVRQPVIAKTDPDGNTAGCAILPTCLHAKDIEIELEPLGIAEVAATDSLEDFSLNISPISFSFSEGCNSPPVPSPEFIFPDTLCVMDSMRTSGTNNHLANAHEWHLIGTNVDSIITDSFDFGFRFHDAGEYILRQTVWVLGCAYMSEKNIVILPEIEVDITPEYICPDGPFEITANSNGDIKEYIWGNGTATADLPINSPGIYSIEINNGHCTTRDTLEVKFLSDIIGNENPILLPDDSIVCEIHLPYLLNIKSDYTDVFLINGNNVMGNEYMLENKGEYIVSTKMQDCHFSNIYTLGTSTCDAAIYFPNIFSPNGDGINDEFYPQGKYFEALSLKIYDRWGGLMFFGEEGQVSWRPDINAAEGIYLFHFSYRNILTGQEGVLSGEVMLVK